MNDCVYKSSYKSLKVYYIKHNLLKNCDCYPKCRLEDANKIEANSPEISSVTGYQYMNKIITGTEKSVYIKNLYLLLN